MKSIQAPAAMAATITSQTSFFIIPEPDPALGGRYFVPADASEVIGLPQWGQMAARLEACWLQLGQTTTFISHLA